MTPRPLLAAIAFLAVPAVASAQVQLSEIRVGQPGLDTQEYVEFRAAPGTSLAGLTLVVIGDAEGQTAPGQNGFIEEAVTLAGSVGATGHFVLAESTFTLALADLVRPLNFEDPDNVTFLLVTGFSGSVGQSLDTNFDGTLDVTPWASVVDSVALVSTQSPNGTTSEFVYSGTLVGPDGATSPSYVWRCSNTGAWTIGASDLSVAGDTPGAENPTCSAGGPLVRISEIRIDMPGNDDNEYFELEGTPGTLLNGYTYIVLGDAEPTNDGYVETVVSLDGLVIPASGYLLVAEPSFTLTTPDFVTSEGQLNFENSDNVTHMLVRGFTGALDNDLHTGTSCVLDFTPWTAVVDAVGIKSPDTTCIFADVYVGPDGTFAPGHIYRCSSDGTWTLGAFTIEAGGDTPGAENRACSLGPPVECGDDAAGSCSQPRSTPYCSNGPCCTSVCTLDPSCCTVAWDADCVTQAGVTCAAGESSCDRAAVYLNEIRIDMPLVDTLEFIEIAGTPGAALDVTIIIIGDGTTAQASGVVERVRSLAGVTIPADGTLLVGNPALNPDVGNGAGTSGANLAQDWIENSDNITIFLVRGWTGTLGQDLDTNDDGTLDITPWTEIVDGIALLESTATPPIGTEWAYGDNRIGPDGTFVPGHIWRCRDTGCWNIGLFDPILNAEAGNETPGTDNAGCGGENPCPADVNGDGSVGGLDLTALLAGWGGNDAAADINGDGTVGGLDLTALLAAWGTCP